MQKPLSKTDIKELRYRCLPAFIVSQLAIFIGIAACFSYNYIQYDRFALVIDSTALIIIVSSVLMAFLILGFSTPKFLQDISNGIKKGEKKIIKAKEEKESHEAGSGKVGPVAMRMKQLMVYYLIIDNERHMVEKELYDKANKGDEIIIYYAPKSNYQLNMELVKDSKEN